MKIIEINKDLIPYQFEINLEEETFQFDVKYNEDGDFFTVDLYKDHNLVVLGEKIVYGSFLFDRYKHLDIPKSYLIALDQTGEADCLNWDNLANNVFLFAIESSDIDVD